MNRLLVAPDLTVLVALAPVTGPKEGPNLRERVGQDVGVAVAGSEEPVDGVAPGIAVPIC